MSASLPGNRSLPASQYDLNSYWGRVRQSADIADPRTLFVSASGLEHAKQLITNYKQGRTPSMSLELWQAKKVVDATLHPDTSEPVFLPFRMSCFIITNLIVTAGMLTPGMGTRGTVAWQIINQSLNVGINSANANKSSPLATETLVKSYLYAVSASVSVAIGLKAIVPRLKVSPGLRTALGTLVPFAAVASAGVLNIFLMRGEEIKQGIDIYPAQFEEEKEKGKAESLGKSKKAAFLAVGETALSRVINATPVMAIPPLILVRLQQTDWLKARPNMVIPTNLGLILTASILALPLALAVFPQRQAISTEKLEPEFHGKGGKDGLVEFNRGI